MKKIIIAVAALGVVLVGGLAFVWSNLDGLVKDAIEHYGSEATRTEVSVASVKIGLEDGSGAISGLTVANPSGFTDAYIFSLGKIATSIDVSTITNNPVVIDEIVIAAPALFYEIDGKGSSNVDQLKKSLASGSSAGSSSSESGETVKLIIRKLVVERGEASVRIAALGDSARSVKLPRIVLTDVGKKSNGATAAEVAQILSSKLIANLQSSVTKLGVDQYLGKSVDQVKQQMLEKSKGKLGGQMGGAASDALKGVFGN